MGLHLGSETLLALVKFAPPSSIDRREQTRGQLQILGGITVYSATAHSNMAYVLVRLRDARGSR